MYKKIIEMSFEEAVKISSDLLDVFQLLFEQREHPIKLSLWNEENYENNDCPDIIYKIFQNNRYFYITFFDEPEDLGYCSLLPDFDPSTYVICNIVEKRPNGTKKYEMSFGFDIEKRTFLELFELEYLNTVNILREYPNLNTRLESELKDTIIILD